VSTQHQRVVLVTGAAGGIGAATARTLAAEGAALVVHDVRRDGRLAELADELGTAAHALAADLRDPAAADALWHEAVAWRGHIDVLINNAGIYEAASPDGDLATWQAAWERTLAICLVSPAALCRAAIASFREQSGGGIIVNLASRAAWRGEDADYWHYAAAKAGVVAMTKTIARA
jgi:3-oxoacyl-[acyl-carrier protein] reductase